MGSQGYWPTYYTLTYQTKDIAAVPNFPWASVSVLHFYPSIHPSIHSSIHPFIYPSIHPSICSFRQHDAQEFLQSLLFLLHDELNKPKKRATSPSPRNARYSIGILYKYLNDPYSLSFPLSLFLSLFSF